MYLKINPFPSHLLFQTLLYIDTSKIQIGNRVDFGIAAISDLQYCRSCVIWSSTNITINPQF